MYRKIIIGVVLLSLTMLSIAALQFWTLGRLQDEISDLQRNSVDRLGHSIQINNYQDVGFSRTMELITTTSPAKRAQLLDDIEDVSAKNEAVINDYAKKLPETANHDRLNNLIATRQRYLTVRSQVIEFIKQDRQPEAVAVFQNSLRQVYDAYSQAVDDLLTGDTQSIKRHAVLVNKFGSITLYLVPAIGFLGLLIGAIAPFLGFMFLSETAYDPNTTSFRTADQQHRPRRIKLMISILIALIILIILGIIAHHFIKSRVDIEDSPSPSDSSTAGSIKG